MKATCRYCNVPVERYLRGALRSWVDRLGRMTCAGCQHPHAVEAPW